LDLALHIITPAEDTDPSPLTSVFKSAGIEYVALSPHRTDVYRVTSGIHLMPIGVVVTRSSKVACIVLGAPSEDTTAACLSHAGDPSLGVYIATTATLEQWGMNEAYSKLIPPEALRPAIAR
jgi:hypothetical protein